MLAVQFRVESRQRSLADRDALYSFRKAPSACNAYCVLRPLVRTSSPAALEHAVCDFIAGKLQSTTKYSPFTYTTPSSLGLVYPLVCPRKKK